MEWWLLQKKRKKLWDFHFECFVFLVIPLFLMCVGEFRYVCGPLNTSHNVPRIHISYKDKALRNAEVQSIFQERQTSYCNGC